MAGLDGKRKSGQGLISRDKEGYSRVYSRVYTVDTEQHIQLHIQTYTILAKLSHHSHSINLTFMLFILIHNHPHPIIINLHGPVMMSSEEPREGGMESEALDTAALGFVLGYQ